MSTAYTIPLVNGDGTQFALTLNLPVQSGLTPPITPYITGAKVTWASSAHSGGPTHVGVLSPSNDGLSCLYTVGMAMASADTETITATYTTAAGGVCGSWQPGRLYRLGDQIVASGHLQQVTSAARLIPVLYTPLSGKIPSVTANTNLGDGGWFAERSAALNSVTALAAFSIDPNGLNFILNQGDGDINGDWPAGALQVGPDTNAQGSKTGSYLSSTGVVTAGLNPGPVSAALVTVIAAGFSSGANYIAYPGANEAGTSVGIESPVPTVLTLSSVAASSGGVAVYTGTIAANATAAAALVGLTFTVQGFVNTAVVSGVLADVNNGTFICTAATTTTLTLNNPSAKAETHVAQAIALTTTDSRKQYASYTEVGAGAKGTFVITGATYPSVLGGAGYTDYAGTFTGGAASAFAGLAFTVAGFVTNPGNNGTFLCTASTAILLTVANANGVTEVHAATAVNTGVRAYLDGQGNAHVGWLVAQGTQDFSVPVSIPPTFSTSGGTTLDNELIWTDQGAAATTTTKSVVLTVQTGASVPLGYSALLG